MPSTASLWQSLTKFDYYAWCIGVTPLGGSFYHDLTTIMLTCSEALPHMATNNDEYDGWPVFFKILLKIYDASYDWISELAAI